MRITRSGFTLVELLIVVAIIGVLATVGVPTFRRMIQKSKQAEAKVILGNILKVEEVFKAEWGAYGNNLSMMGLELDGKNIVYTTPGVTSYYSGGFPTNNSCYGNDVYKPSVGAYKAKLQAEFPQYYTVQANMITFWPAAGTIAKAASSKCLPGTVAADGSNFLATVTGAIAPNVDGFTAPLSQLDQWSIDHNRNLANVNSGIQ